MSKATDTFEAMTAEFVRRIEAGQAGDWTKPWVNLGQGIPTNAVTGKPYRGGNVLAALWAAEDNGFTGPWWATFKQWESVGAQVRKGSTGTRLVFWKFDKRTDDDGSERTVPFAMTFTVFHAEQVDGWTAPEPPVLDTTERLADADRFFTDVGAEVTYGGDRACYMPGTDRIMVPTADQFTDTPGFYSTLAHEHGHWTGHGTRLARDLTGRFGSESYAMEELVAELTAAFVCGSLGVTAAPREDHAGYLANWLTVLRGDAKALWRAASEAQRAHDYLMVQAGWVDADVDVEVAA
jgi:antirestriction protein ArdC